MQEWRENWRVGSAIFLALSFSLGAYMTASSMFIIPLQNAFGWSRSEIAFAHNAGIVSALLSPFFGRLADRCGARPIMLVGGLIFGSGYLGLALMHGSLPLFYTLFVIIFVSGLSTSGLICSRVVSEAFILSRGFSLAAARSGMALAGAVLPAILYIVITHHGWRAGYMVQALLVLFLVWPAIFFWVGRGKTVKPASQRSADTQWRTLLSERRLWILCLAASLGYAPATALMSQLQPILIDKDISALSAASLVGLAGVASFGGALVTGVLVDRFWAPGVALIFACGSAAGCVLLASASSLDEVFAAFAIVLIGLGLGAEIDVVAFIVARYFGVQNFSTLYGVMVLFMSFSGAISAWSLGSAYDRFGDYNLALYVMAGVFFSAGLTYLLLGRYPAQKPA